MKKLFFIFLLFLVTICFISQSVSAQLNQPDLKTGDWWTYDRPGSFTTIEEATRDEVIGEETINVDGTDYDVIVLKRKTPYSIQQDVDTEEEWISSYQNITYYYRKSDLALVKDVSVNDDGTAINTYSPPWKLVDYPVTVGKTWYINYTETSTGGYLGDEVETTDYSMFCECIETNQTTLSKGTFDCYVVKVLTVTDGIKEYRVFYNYFFAPEGGIYPIKMDAYQMGQYVASNNALNDYGSAESDDPVTDDSEDSDNTDDTSSDDSTTEETSNDDSGSGTPGFELIIVFCSIFFVFLWKQRKYKK